MAKPTEVSGLGPLTPVGEAGRRLVLARLGDVRRYEEPLVAERGVEVVHDMRVATRRLREALRLFGKDGLAAVDAEVKPLQDALGAVRDVHVQREWRAKRHEDAGADEQAALSALGLAHEQHLAAHDEALLAAVARFAGETAGRIEDGLAGVEERGRLGGRRLRAKLARRFGRIARGVKRTVASPDAATAHRLRIAVKRFRYLAELVANGFPGTVAAMLEVMVPLQEDLGALHDADVRLGLLAKLAADATGPERDGALALLAHVETDRGERVAELLAELARLAAEDLLRGLADLVA